MCDPRVRSTARPTISVTMGLFAKKKGADAPTSSASGGKGKGMDANKAASVIEKRGRGMLARQKTADLKAQAAITNGPLAPLFKCLPCLAPK